MSPKREEKIMQMKQPEEFNIQIPQIKEHRRTQISKIVKKQIRKQI